MTSHLLQDRCAPSLTTKFIRATPLLMSKANDCTDSCIFQAWTCALPCLLPTCVHAAVAELEDLRNSIAELRLAIADLNANTDPAETAVLKINVRESRSSLAMRLQRLTPASLVASVRSCDCSNPIWAPRKGGEKHQKEDGPITPVARKHWPSMKCNNPLYP